MSGTGIPQAANPGGILAKPGASGINGGIAFVPGFYSSDAPDLLFAWAICCGWLRAGLY